MELEVHPAVSVAYTLTLEIAKNRRIEKVITIDGEEVGYKDHNIIANTSERIGAV